MPLKDPGDYRDRTADWLQFFAQTRQRQLAPLVTPALIAEHAEDPRGGDTQHSHALQDVLNYLHYMPVDGKSFAYAVVPYQEYKLGIMRARGNAPLLGDQRTFSSEREAVHAVFMQRLVQMGLLPDEAEDKA